MESYKTSEKMFDCLMANEKKVNLHKAEELLVGCKIIGVEFGAESIDKEETVTSIFLHLERPNGSKFMLDCCAFEWDEKEQSYTWPASLTVYKSEFPKEVM